MDAMNMTNISEDHHPHYDMVDQFVKSEHKTTEPDHTIAESYQKPRAAFLKFISADIAAKEANLRYPDKDNVKILANSMSGLMPVKLRDEGFSYIDCLCSVDAFTGEKMFSNTRIKGSLDGKDVLAGDDTYDGVWLVGGLHSGESCPNLKDIIKIIKPGGVLYISSGPHCTPDTERVSVTESLDDLVGDDLCTWTFQGTITDQGHTETVWILTICKGIGRPVRPVTKAQREELFVFFNQVLLTPDITNEQRDKLYTEYAHLYDKYTKTWRYLAPKMSAAQAPRYFPDKNCRILDACAGTGQVGEELQKLGFINLDYLDINEGLMVQAEKKNIYQRFIRCLLGKENIDAGNGTYDGVWLVGALCPGHISPEDFTNCFKEIARVCKPGGIFYGSIGLELFPNETKQYLIDVKKAFDELVHEGLWIWRCCGQLTEVHDREAVWVLSKSTASKYNSPIRGL